MNTFQFFKFLNEELMDVIDYHTLNKSFIIKEVYMQGGITTFIFDEISMDGFKEQSISIPNSRLIK